MSGKDQVIDRQRKVMLQQREQIHQLQQMKNEFAKMTQPKDTITLDGIQKVRELAPEDKYNVLEFLVKEMMGVKEFMPHRRE